MEERISIKGCTSNVYKVMYCDQMEVYDCKNCPWYCPWEEVEEEVSQEVEKVQDTAVIIE